MRTNTRALGALRQSGEALARRCGVGRAVLAVTLLSLAACAGSPALRAAERGDHQALAREIASRRDRGELSGDDAARIARAVASREITASRDEATALTRLRETRACARELDDALEDRMKTRDGAGAEAALARLEDGRLGDGAARDHLGDADDRWRAVGTRTLHRGDDGEPRRRAMLDPSPRVRRSALRASAEAKEVADLDVLLETARVDPELLLQNEAIRAISAILRGDDGRARAADVATRLGDLYTSGDDAVREDVAVAWALEPVFGAGGREALRRHIAEGRGPGAIAAAGVVLRTAAGDEELAASASALVARVVAEGSRRDRLHAVASARLVGIELEALRAASKDDDLDVRVPALGRLLDSPPDRDASIRALEPIAGQGIAKGPKGEELPSTPREREHAQRARLALAYAGHVRIQAWIEADLSAPEPTRRLGAASALAALKRGARAAPLLADADPSVRTRAACTLMVASRR